METSTYQNLKLEILNVVGLSKDAVHIHIGLVIFLCTVLIWKKGQVKAVCLIPVFLIALSMELLDLRDDWLSLGYMQWSASIHDMVNTTFWPVVLFCYGRYCERRNNYL